MKSLLLSTLILVGSIHLAQAQREAWRVTPDEIYEIAATGTGGCVAIQKASDGPWKAVVYTAKGTVQAETTLADFDPSSSGGPEMVTANRFYIQQWNGGSPVYRCFSVKKGKITSKDLPLDMSDVTPTYTPPLTDKTGFFVFRREEGTARIIRYKH